MLGSRPLVPHVDDPPPFAVRSLVPPRAADDAEEWLGYTGARRWLGVWWDHDADELALDDGATLVVGAGAGGQRFVEQIARAHAVAALELAGAELGEDGPVDLGSDRTPATHAALLDRDARAWYFARLELARPWLARQATIALLVVLGLLVLVGCRSACVDPCPLTYPHTHGTATP